MCIYKIPITATTIPAWFVISVLESYYKSPGSEIAALVTTSETTV
jgi:hypothetical protein